VLGTQETFCIVIAGLFERDSFDLFLPEFDKPWVIHLRETCYCSTNLCTWRPNTVYKNKRVCRHHSPPSLVVAATGLRRSGGGPCPQRQTGGLWPRLARESMEAGVAAPGRWRRRRCGCEGGVVAGFRAGGSCSRWRGVGLGGRRAEVVRRSRRRRVELASAQIR
jgi:hypothetical protein